MKHDLALCSNFYPRAQFIDLDGNKDI